MITIAISSVLALFGAVFGSFAGAQVWRLRAQQLAFEKKHGEAYDAKEYKKLKKLLGASVSKDRSRCLECGYQLKWYDLIPLVSWVSLGGKCRSCRRRIGAFEPIIELSVAVYFVGSFLLWPIELTSALAITHFVLWLIAGVIMAVLFAYDAKWFILPDRYSIALAVVGAAITAIVATQADNWGTVVFDAVLAVGVIAGLYGALYVVSRGQWVGLGDVKLGVGLGLILMDWQLAIVAVFLANLIGCIIVIPLMATKKLTRDARIPFGPMLLVGTVLAWFFGRELLRLYLGGAGF